MNLYIADRPIFFEIFIIEDVLLLTPTSTISKKNKKDSPPTPSITNNPISLTNPLPFVTFPD